MSVHFAWVLLVFKSAYRDSKAYNLRTPYTPLPRNIILVSDES